MGPKIAENLEEESEAEELQPENLEEAEPKDEESPEDELKEDESEEDDTEEEDDSEGEGSQPPGKHPRGFIRRIQKLKAKTEVVKDENRQKDDVIARQQQEIELYKLAEQTKSGGPKKSDEPPNPDDYDDGYLDPKYIKDNRAHTKQIIEQTVASQVSELTRQASVKAESDRNASEKEASLSDHYTKAKALNIKDYLKYDDIAWDILGEPYSEFIIATCGDSPQVMDYLGRNPKEAKALVAVTKANPAKGVLRLGAIEAKLKAKPRSSVIPEPDEELGGSVTSHKGKSWLDGATFA